MGFVVGLEGVHHFAIQLMSGNGVTFIPCALVTFFCAAQLMCAAPHRPPGEHPSRCVLIAVARCSR